MFKKKFFKARKVRASRIISPFGRNTVLPGVSEDELNFAINSSVARIKRMKKIRRVCT